MRLPLTRGSVVVQRGDDALFRAHVGQANPGAGTPTSAATRYQLASISKQVTATAVLLLAERGALTVADPVSRWFAGADGGWRDVTLHQLLTHTSGAGHWDDYPELDLFHRPDRDVADLVLARAPLTRPGTTYAYSSPGYVLLAHVVAAAAGTPYARFVDEQLFAPLDLAAFVGDGHSRPDLAVPMDGDRPLGSFELDHVGVGAGDVWATADDLLRWDAAVARGAVLAADSVEAMFRRHVEVPAEVEQDGSGYGYGWVLGDLGGAPARFHGGHNAGFEDLHVWWPGPDLRLAVLTNDDRTDRDGLHRLAAEVLARWG